MKNLGGKRMKSLSKYILLFVISNLVYCASVKRYMYNRGNDLTDIVNIGVEKGVYGFNTQTIGVLGFQNASSGVGFGMRNGHFGLYKTGDDENVISFLDGNERKEIYFGNSDLLSSTNYHEPYNSTNLRNLKKQIKRLEFLFNTCNSSSAHYKENYISIHYINFRGKRCYFSDSYTVWSVELSVGLYLGFRLGVNLNEFADFFAGIAGYDLEYDDISNNEPLNRELPLPASEKSKVEVLDEKMDRRVKK